VNTSRARDFVFRLVMIVYFGSPEKEGRSGCYDYIRLVWIYLRLLKVGGVGASVSSKACGLFYIS